MELIIGGAYQGKKEIAKQLFRLQEEDILNGYCCEPEELFEKKAVYGFHMLVRRMMEQNLEMEAFFEELTEKNSDLILISDEIGYGIVPLDRFEREWREKTGRICCLAAQRAEHVIRVVAGVPVFLKGERA